MASFKIKETNNQNRKNRLEHHTLIMEDLTAKYKFSQRSVG